MAKTEVGVAKAEVGMTKAEVGVAKAEVGVANPGGSESGVTKRGEERSESGGGDGGDSEYLASESEGEDETTIAEQETHEGAVDHHSEVSALEKEGTVTSEQCYEELPGLNL